MQDKKPNIIFILTDQQSANMMNCAGNKYLKTPAMDSLAANGVLFQNAYCTNPVCLPSRFSLLSGRYPSETGVRNNVPQIKAVQDRILETNPAQLLQEAGYENAYGGKVHLPPGMHPKDMGFEIISLDERDKLADDCAEYIKRPHENPYFLFASFINPHDICYMAIRAFAETEHEKGLIERGKIEVATLDKALEIPENMSEEEFFEKICPILPPNFEPQQDEPEAVKMIREQRSFKKKAHENWTEKEWRMHRWAYSRLSEMVDAQIAKVLQAVRDSGQEENTVIIFTSDHGDMDSARRMEHKTTLYEEPTKIPLIVSDPRLSTAGTTNKTHIISNGLDLIPTICDYAGVNIPNDLQGLSFKGLAEGKNPEQWRESLLVESEFGNMIRTENYKYALYYKGKNREQLYDLVNDPYENRNCANDTDKKTILLEHRQILKKALEEQEKRRQVATA